MELNGLVSIIMPIKNAERFLTDCVDSILSQDDSGWELIAVDDHSEDNSLKLIQAYADKDSRIQIWVNDGSGIIPALEKGMDKSNGEFITRMDADDIMDSRKIRLLKELLIHDKEVDVSVGKVEYFSDHALGAGYQRYADWLNSLVDNNQFWKDVYRECVIPSPCWMMRKVDLIRMGGIKGYGYPEDYDLCFRMYQHGLQVRGVPINLHKWRDHALRSSRTQEVYLDPWYLDIKLHYFFEIDYRPDAELFVWGAGKKGKYLAQKLIEAKINFRWMSNNPKKIGKEIYSILIEAPLAITKARISSRVSIIIPISNRDEQRYISTQLIRLNYLEGKDFFFFN